MGPFIDLDPPAWAQNQIFRAFQKASSIRAILISGVRIFHRGCTFPSIRTQDCPSLGHPDPRLQRPLKITTSTLSCTQKYTSSQCSSHINGITCTEFLENITGKFFSYLLRDVPLSSVGFNLKYCNHKIVI